MFVHAQKIRTHKKIRIRAKNSVRMQKYGRARKNMDTRAKIWTRAQKYGHARQKYEHVRNNIDMQELRCTKIKGTKILKV